MWDDASQRHLDELQRRAEHEPLPIDDQRALEELVHTLEEEEWAAIRPALVLQRRIRRRVEWRAVHAAGAVAA